MEEKWLDVPGYDGLYQVSNLGWLRRDGKIKKLNNSLSNKYLRTTLSKKGVQTTWTIHRLVWLTFRGSLPNLESKMVIDHIDNDYTNNKLSNLQCITQAENSFKDRVSSSKYLGVYYEKVTKGWVAKTSICKGPKIYLGSFKTEEEANIAYNIGIKNFKFYNGDPIVFREVFMPQTDRYVFYRKDNKKWRFMVKKYGISAQYATKEKAIKAKLKFFKALLKK
jgi:uncharacterized protein YnzC (UPF0291/DUF896 family)